MDFFTVLEFQRTKINRLFSCAVQPMVVKVANIAGYVIYSVVLFNLW